MGDEFVPTHPPRPGVEERLPAPVKPEKRVPDFAYGFLCGLAAMATVTWLAMGRM